MPDYIDGAFPSTDWSEIRRAGDDDPFIRGEALRCLLTRYLWPMQVHLRRRQRMNADAAEEIVQEFLVSKVLARDLLSQADSKKGRFRTFLLTALDRFALNAVRDHRVARRVAPDSLTQALDPALSLDEEFDAAWARQVLSEALRHMRDHCQREGRDDIWSIFEARLISPALDDARPIPYHELVERLNLNSVAEGFNLLATAKRTFARSLRWVVGEYETDPLQVEDEIASLRSALSRRRV